MPTSLPDLLTDIQRLPSDPVPAFIAGIASTGLSFLRSLGRRGIPLVALDSWRDPGMYSRYGLSAVVPDPVQDEQGLLSTLQEMGEAVSVRSVLIPTSDAFTLFVTQHSRELAEHFDFNLPDYAVVQTLANKRLQYEYAQQQGVETPRTRFPSDVAIEEIAQEMDYPCIIKPYFSHLWRQASGNRWGKAAEVHSARELIETYAEMRRYGPDLMVQQKIAGADDQLYGVNFYLDRSSQVLAVFTKHKLRQYPRGFGDGSTHLGIWVPEIAELGSRLLRGLGFRGVAHVEFKRDPEDGQFKLIEINPRSSAAIYHSVVSGVDIPHMAYRDARGQHTEEALTFRDGVTWINLAPDFKSFLEGRRVGDSDLGLWLKSLKGDRCFAFFTWDDPLPAFLGLWEFARANLRR